MLSKGCLAVAFCLLTSCITATAPLEEYTLADIAIKAARTVQAVRYSPGNWNQAEEHFRQARILYNEREYDEARQLFIKAKLSAERAENSARLLRQQNGDVL